MLLLSPTRQVSFAAAGDEEQHAAASPALDAGVAQHHQGMQSVAEVRALVVLVSDDPMHYTPVMYQHLQVSVSPSESWGS